MRRPSRVKSLAAGLLAASAFAHAQPAQPAPPPAAPAASGPIPANLQQACATVPQQPAQARLLALRSQCVLVGLVPSPRRYAEARELARKSLEAGDPAGGFMLFLAFSNDPENTYLRDGKPDMDRYRKLGQRSLQERREQVEAIDALAFAAGKGHVNAGLTLANYYHDTVAPGNVVRLRALVEVLVGVGERDPVLERFRREVDAVEKTAPATKASVHAFLDAYQGGVAAALSGYTVQTGGRKCEQATLRSVSAGDITGAEFLPLSHRMAAQSFLVRGEWPEYWTFLACGEDVPVKLTFVADGWGGASFAAMHNKGG